MFKFFEKRRREKEIIEEHNAEEAALEIELQNKKNFDAYIQQTTDGESFDCCIVTSVNNLYTPFHMQYIKNATPSSIFDAGTFIGITFDILFNEYELYIYELLTIFNQVEFFPKDSEIPNGKITITVDSDASELQEILLNPTFQKILEKCPNLLQQFMKIVSKYTPDIFRHSDLKLEPFDQEKFDKSVSSEVCVSEDGKYTYDKKDGCRRRLYAAEWHLRTDRGKELFELTSGSDNLNYISMNTEDYGYIYFFMTFDEDFNHPDVIPIVEVEEDDRIYSMEELIDKFPDQIL